MRNGRGPLTPASRPAVNIPQKAMQNPAHFAIHAKEMGDKFGILYMIILKGRSNHIHFEVPYRESTVSTNISFLKIIKRKFSIIF